MGDAGREPDRLNILFCGGSQLVAWGLPRTQAVPVLVSRELRARVPDRVGRSQLVSYPGHPAELLAELETRLPGQPTIVVFVPRNVFIFGVESAEEGAEPRRRLVDDLRMYLRHAGLVLAMPFRLRRYGRALDALLTVCARHDCRLVVFTTPVPIARRRALHTRLYQSALARTVRRRVRPGVVLADVYRVLQEPAPAPLHAADDPGHLTIEGQQRVAGTILRAIEESGVLEPLEKTG